MLKASLLCAIACAAIAASNRPHDLIHTLQADHRHTLQTDEPASPFNKLMSLPRLCAVEPSVSGVSSGADMAVMYTTAHSSSVAGLGVFAGNAYRCAITRQEGDGLVACDTPQLLSLGTVLVGCTLVDPRQAPCDPPCPPGYGLPPNKCMGCLASQEYIPLQNVSVLANVARARARRGLIDAPEHLRGKPILLHLAQNDGCYEGDSVLHTAQFFEEFGARTVLLDRESFAGHHVPVAHPRADGTAGDLISNASDIDGPRRLLEHIYGEVEPAVPMEESRLFRFDQSEFDPDGLAGLDPHGGLVYIPSACASCGEQASSPCRIHVYLHGCDPLPSSSDASNVLSGQMFAEAAGNFTLNEYAEANNIIALYPRLSFGEDAVGRSEESHCWDQTGQTGDSFSDREGVQISAVHRMVTRLMGA